MKLFAILITAVSLSQSTPEEINNTAINLVENNLDSALELSEVAFDEAMKEKDRFQALRANFITAYVYDEKGMHNNAALNYLSCLDFITRHKVKGAEYYELSALKNLGRISRVLGLYNKAHEYYDLALPVAKKYSSDEEAGILYNQGYLYYTEGKYLEALDKFLETLDLARELKDFNRASKIYNQIGLSYSKLANYSESNEYLYRVITMEQVLKTNKARKLGLAYHNIAWNHLHSGDTTKAIYMWREALEKYKSSNQFVSSMDLGELYSKLGKSDSALHYLSNALGLITDQDLHPEKFKVYKHLADLFKADQDWNQYSSYNDLYTESWEKYYLSEKKIRDLTLTYQYQWTLENYGKRQQQQILIEELEMILVLLLPTFLIILIVVSQLIKISSRKKAERIMRDTMNEIKGALNP